LASLTDPAYALWLTTYESTFPLQDAVAFSVVASVCRSMHVVEPKYRYTRIYKNSYTRVYNKFSHLPVSGFDRFVE